MENNTQEEIFSEIEKFRSLWNEYLEILSGHLSSLSDINFQPIDDRSINEFSTEILTAIELIDLIPFQDSLLQAVHSFRARVKKLLVELKESTSVLNDSIQYFHSAEVETINENLVAQGTTNGQQSNRDLANDLEQIQQRCSAAVDQISYLKPFIDTKQAGDLSNRIAALISVHEKALEHLNIIHDVGKKADGSFSKIAAFEKRTTDKKKSIDSIEDQCREIKTELDKVFADTNDSLSTAQTNASNKLNEIDAKLKLTQETSKVAEDVRAKVDAYQSEFKKFDESLKKRNEAFESFTAYVNKASESYEEQRQNIDDLIERSDSMISGATIAGLSTSLNNAASDYSKSAEDANRRFYFSLFLMFLSTLPLMFYVFEFPFLESFISGEPGKTIDITLAGIIGRLILILPAFWLASFTSSQYSRMFNLSKDYRFKATLAQSVDGFKKQAPTYEEEIAGSVLMDIREKPVAESLKHGQAPQTPNPIIQWFLDKARKTIDKNNNE